MLKQAEVFGGFQEAEEADREGRKIQYGQSKDIARTDCLIDDRTE